MIERASMLCVPAAASLLLLPGSGHTQLAQPTLWTGEWWLQHTFSPAPQARADAGIYAGAATTVTVTFPEDVPQPTDELELQFMRVCTSTDPNLQARVVHAPATKSASGDAWEASFMIPEPAGEPRGWTMWAFYPSEAASGLVQVIQGAFAILVVPAETDVAALVSPMAIRPPDCRRPGVRCSR